MREIIEEAMLIAAESKTGNMSTEVDNMKER